MQHLVFDIETGPRSNAAEFYKQFPSMQDFDPAAVKTGNIKDAARIAEKVAAAEASHLSDYLKAKQEHDAKQEDKAALNAMTCEVLAIGVQINNAAPEIHDTGDEAATIQLFWDHWKQTGSDCSVVGWNCAAFDIPILIRRSRALGVDVPYNVCNLYRGRVYQSERITDLMVIWACGDYQHRDSLKNVARLLGVGDKDAEGGEHYHQMRQDDPAAARAYLINDIAVTYKVGQRMGVCK